MKVSEDLVKNKILIIRGKKVMLDSDLAELYQVPTMRLNEQVKRNSKRFPEDFMFQLTVNEKKEVIAKCDNLSRLRFSSHLPYAFTEHGVAMLSSVLKSDIAVQMNIFIIRTFIKMRELAYQYKDLEGRVVELERTQDDHGSLLIQLHSAVKHLIEKPENPKEKIGFREKED